MSGDFLTVSEVARRVAEIDGMKGDAEAAHSSEDGLWREVLRNIADGCPYPRSLAMTALQTTDLDFPRWCA